MKWLKIFFPPFTECKSVGFGRGELSHLWATLSRDARITSSPVFSQSGLYQPGKRILYPEPSDSRQRASLFTLSFATGASSGLAHIALHWV